jgi:2-octaprenyl-6-methoxyphenol hydroxylase
VPGAVGVSARLGASNESYDVAIVGGGMVGASLAVALEGLGVRTALIEAVPHDAAAQPSFDERTTALSNGSRRILETLGVWQELACAATRIAKIHVSDQGHFGFARIDATELGRDALGYVVPNRALGTALWSRLARRPDLDVFCPARVTAIDLREDAVELGIAPDRILRTRLVVAADGIESMVRKAFGVGVEARDYVQAAIITTVLPGKFHEHVAYERFTPSGPLALLPIADGRCALVLTLSPAAAEVAMGWSDEEFLVAVQARFGWRLGRLLKVGGRRAYPLSLSRAERSSAGRCVLVGNAAQALHPVAGMGFNLGLRDVASLAELIAEGRGELDTVAAAYDVWRAPDRREVIAFTDGLVRVFASPFGPVRRLRNLGLLAFDLLPPAKAALSALSIGAAGRIPKLARGVPLRAAS